MELTIFSALSLARPMTVSCILISGRHTVVRSAVIPGSDLMMKRLSFHWFQFI